MIVEIYKDYEIIREPYGYTVVFCGDEVVHDTIEAARTFIDEIWEKEDQNNDLERVY